MKTIRIGIIGVGLIGKSHLENYAKLPGAKVIAVCDIREGEAKAVAAKYDVPHVYTDYKKLLERNDLDAVDVCLHNNYHAPVSIAAMEAGKHVYCEKPIAGSYVDGKRMVERARQLGTMLHIQLGTLYRKETRAAKALIEEGELGRLFHARATGFRRRNRPFVDGFGTACFTRKETAGGGAVFDMGVYHIAQMLYLLNLPKIERISGKTYQEMEMDAQRQAESGFDVEELGLGFVRFAGGVTMDVIEAWSVHLGSFEAGSVIGSKGGIRLPAYGVGGQPFSYYTTRCDIDLDCTVDLDRMALRWRRLRKNDDAYESSQHHWIAALQGRVPLLPTAEIALQTMLISEGIYLSDSLGREVTADEVIEKSISLSLPI